MTSGNRISITIRFFQNDPRLDERRVKERLQKLLELLEVRADELSIAFVDDAQMSEYNKSYRDIEGTTDVLSFPYGEITEEGRFNLGDIIISVDAASRQAEELGHSFRREIDILMAHAVLHLLGYDHEKDSGEMLERQSEIMSRLTADDGV